MSNFHPFSILFFCRPNRPAQIQPTKIVPVKSKSPPAPPRDEKSSISPPKQVRMTLKNSVKPVSKAVLEKLGEESHFNTEDDDYHSNSKSLKRKAEIEDELERVDKPAKKDRRGGGGADKADKKKEKKSAADRREELLKQLKAVENAIAKKRTKINSER